MYFKDLTSYTYLNREPNPNVLAVGWLDAEHEFTKGSVPESVLERILALCFKPMNQTRGFHQSPFLKPSLNCYSVEYKGKQMGLGSAEIRVTGQNGRIYAAPNLIYHYIKDCGYLPPQEFLDAVASMPVEAVPNTPTILTKPPPPKTKMKNVIGIILCILAAFQIVYLGVAPKADTPAHRIQDWILVGVLLAIGIPLSKAKKKPQDTQAK